jgi:uncharacterized protein YneF (UPF0154 family)
MAEIIMLVLIWFELSLLLGLHMGTWLHEG